MEQITFIHAADLHLDSPFQGFGKMPEELFQDVKESTFSALDRLVQIAIQKQVDFVLLVGDLFDNAKQSLKAQIRLKRAFEQLEQHRINVYLSYGNHDYIQGNIHPVTYPDNVFTFPDEGVSHFTFEKNGKRLANIYGFSYEQQAVTENKTREYCVQDENIPFHIATLHGSVQSNTEHDTYAPFTLRELLEKPFHYWALGHIHKRQILHSDPPVVYPGNIQGRNRKETGEKGCYYVTLSETGAELAFIPLQALEIVPAEVDVSHCREIQELEKVVLNKLQEKQLSSPQLIDLQIRGKHPLLTEWENSHRLEDMIELVNEILAVQVPWQYIFRVTTKTEHDFESDSNNPFLNEMMQHMEEVAVFPYVSELYRHRHGRKFLATLTEEDEQEIKMKAKKLLLHGLLEE